MLTFVKGHPLAPEGDHLLLVVSRCRQIIIERPSILISTHSTPGTHGTVCSKHSEHYLIFLLMSVVWIGRRLFVMAGVMEINDG